MKIPMVYQCEVIILLHNFLWNVSWRHTLFDPEMHHSFPPKKIIRITLAYVQYILDTKLNLCDDLQYSSSPCLFL